jgi:hypothetical protein
VAVCLAYRLRVRERSAPTDEDLARLVKAAAATFKHPVHENFSGPFKRALLKEFAAEFFHDLKVERHEGVPVGLLRLMAPSAFGCSRLPKPPTEPRPKAVQKGESRPATVSVPLCSGVDVVPLAAVTSLGPGKTASAGLRTQPSPAVPLRVHAGEGLRLAEGGGPYPWDEEDPAREDAGTADPPAGDLTMREAG